MLRNEFPQRDAVKAVFGNASVAYGDLINKILPQICKESYFFEEIDVFERKASDPISGDLYAGQQYWKEMLSRAHMSSVAAIIRANRWVDATSREYEANNLYGWAACCRSLIESSGDTAMSLSTVPLTLAEQVNVIKSQLSQRVSGPVVTSLELEDSLIHFTHARKIRKEDIAPKSHKALQSAEYIGYIEKMKIEGSADLYRILCELVHPAASSIQNIFEMRGAFWVVSASEDEKILKDLVDKNRKLLGQILMASYNPPVIILKVLHKFAIFSQIDALRHYNFDGIPLWPKIERVLRR